MTRKEDLNLFMMTPRYLPGLSVRKSVARDGIVCIHDTIHPAWLPVNPRYLLVSTAGFPGDEEIWQIHDRSLQSRLRQRSRCLSTVMRGVIENMP